MSRKTRNDRHEPDDPDIAEAIRARRVELGLSMAEAARRAGVSDQTWRNYESGRTRVRGDKQIGVWEALGWELPDEWAGLADAMSWLGSYGSMSGGPMLGGLAGGDEDGLPGLEDVVKRALVSSGALENLLGADADALKIPEWDEIPTLLGAGYSPALARMLGENAARCFALGAYLCDITVTEDIDELGSLPRGTHLGQLDNSELATRMPLLWLTRYDYEFVFQMRGVLHSLCMRLTGEGPRPGEPLVHSTAEALALHDAFSVGALVAVARSVLIEEPEWTAWVDALAGPDRLAQRALDVSVVPAAGAPEHIDNWFAPLADPFVPDWEAGPDGAGGAGRADSTGRDDGAGGPGDAASEDMPDATVTPLRPGLR